MDKLSYMKSYYARFVDWTKISRGIRHPTYNGSELQRHNKTDFSHSWANLSKMHDLRVWTIAHAPTKRYDWVRLREIHMLNKEMWSVYQQSVWRRFFTTLIGGILLWKVFNKQLLNQNPNFDSHDPNWR